MQAVATPRESVAHLYQTRSYPATSHPLADPAQTCVTAQFSGLMVPDLTSCRILEIGCGSGLHLIPLAVRWPQSHFVGIDLAEREIALARQLAHECGLTNIEFHAEDLMRFNPAPETRYDVIIAHGFFSWVPDEVKLRMMELIRAHLAPSGMATVSFNVAAGWAARRPFIETVRVLAARRSLPPSKIIDQFLAALPADSPDARCQFSRSVLQDMLEKGDEILGFDEFAAVNDAWSFSHFVQLCAHHGLRWIGECDPAENLPSNLNDVQRAALLPFADDVVAVQEAADAIAGRTFRAGVLCHASAELSAEAAQAQDFSIRLKEGTTAPEAALAINLTATLQAAAPQAVCVNELIRQHPQHPESSIREWVMNGVTLGALAVAHPSLHFYTALPSAPALVRHNRIFLNHGLPLVNAWHESCRFSAQHLSWLRSLDGKLGLSEWLAAHRHEATPEHLTGWLTALAHRGFLEEGPPLAPTSRVPS